MATTLSVARQSADLALAVPQVMAHRLTRLALAGAVPSARDREEFERMTSEKSSAFGAALSAMGAEAVRAQQRLWFQWAGAMWSPGFWTSFAVSEGLQRATLGVLHEGLAPLRRTAVANAERLAHTPPR